MSDFEQIPFVDVDLAENPEPRCPCVLIVDTSSSMDGQKIDQLNAGLRAFAEELRTDSMASKRVEVAIVSFGPVRVLSHFETADTFHPPHLEANGDTPMGAAVAEAARLIADRKAVLRANGNTPYRPWAFLITDGAPTDDISAARAMIAEAEANKSIVFYAVGVDTADLDKLATLSVRKPLRLKGMSFRELFVWLSNSLKTVSRSQPGEKLKLENPAAPDGWAEID